MPKKDTQFKAGQTGNPNGRPSVPKELKEAKKMNALRFEEIVHKLSAMGMDELKEYVGATKPPTKGKADALEAAIAGQLFAAWKGKTSPIAFLMDRVVGPVEHRMKVNLGPYEDLAKMNPDEKDAERARLRARFGIVVGPK